jgi:glyoxylase-like metal-dependent hydrolase (beta-lactamase superfamily II)
VVISASRDAVVIVGPQTAAAQPALRRAIERVSAAPIRFVVITASSTIDASRDAGWGHAGATVIAEEHAALRMASDARSMNDLAAPSLGFSEVQQIHVADEDVHVVRQTPGATDADVSAHFESHGVLYLGDSYDAVGYPTVDERHGGSLDGLIETAAKFMTFGARTKIVPGHGDLSTPASLREYHAMLVGIRDRMQALKRQGKSLDAVIAARPTAAWDARWGSVDGAARALVTAAYSGRPPVKR